MHKVETLELMFMNLSVSISEEDSFNVNSKVCTVTSTM